MLPSTMTDSHLMNTILEKTYVSHDRKQDCLIEFWQRGNRNYHIDYATNSLVKIDSALGFANLCSKFFNYFHTSYAISTIEDIVTKYGEYKTIVLIGKYCIEVHSGNLDKNHLAGYLKDERKKMKEEQPKGLIDLVELIENDEADVIGLIEDDEVDVTIKRDALIKLWNLSGCEDYYWDSSYSVVKAYGSSIFYVYCVDMFDHTPPDYYKALQLIGTEELKSRGKDVMAVIRTYFTAIHKNNNPQHLSISLENLTTSVPQEETVPGARTEVYAPNHAQLNEQQITQTNNQKEPKMEANTNVIDNVTNETLANSKLVVGERIYENIETLVETYLLSRMSWWEKLAMSKKKKELLVLGGVYTLLHAIKTGGFGLTKYRINHELLDVLSLACNHRIQTKLLNGIDTNLIGMILSKPVIDKDV